MDLTVSVPAMVRVSAFKGLHYAAPVLLTKVLLIPCETY